MEEHFKPDSAIKKYLTEISTPKLIGIINGLCGTDYPLDSKVDFLKTEHFSVLGDLDKNSVRGDLVAEISNENHSETTNKIIIELQSTKDNTMGFRMFIYALNVADKNAQNTYVFPKCITIYTTLDLPKSGTDEVNMQVEHFRVGESRYSAENGDLLTVEFPYVNLLNMEINEFDNSLIEPLKPILLYKYKKNPKLMKSDKLEEVVKNVQEFALHQENADKIVVLSIVRDIVVDLAEFCETHRNEYGEEYEIMESLNRTSSEKLVLESRLEGERRGILEGERRGILEGERRGMLEGERRGERHGIIEGQFRVARNLIGKLPNDEIASATGIPLEEIEKLHNENK